jgi:hypothetical protein
VKSRLIALRASSRAGAVLLSRRAWWLKDETHELLKRTQVEQLDKNVWRERPARG